MCPILLLIMGDRLLLCVRYRVQLGHGAPQSGIVLHMLAVDVMIHCHFKYSKITTPFCQLWACGLAGDDAIEFFCFWIIEAAFADVLHQDN